MRQRLLIIGAGMAAAYLLQELDAGADMDITVVGEERDTCYNRVLLSNILAGDSVEADPHTIENGDRHRQYTCRLPGSGGGY